MASKTAQTEYRRHLRRKNAGAAARRARENKGTTPAFPVHSPAAVANAAEKAGAKAKSKKQ
jgi:hypothetical protein